MWRTQVLTSHQHLEAHRPSYCQKVPVGLQGKSDYWCGGSCNRCWCSCWFCWSHQLGKDFLQDAATEDCGLPKNRQWRPETRWWNNRWIKFYKKGMHDSKFTKPWKESKTIEAKEAKTAYNNTKRVAKHDTWHSLRQSKRNSNGDGIFHIAKQMDHRNQVMSRWNATKPLAHLASE